MQYMQSYIEYSKRDDFMVFYTIKELLLDGVIVDPENYLGKHHLRLGKELTAYLTRHNPTRNEEYILGETTRYGEHPFFLTSKPDIDDITYWNAVKHSGYPIVLGCNGYMQVFDHSGLSFTKESVASYSTAQGKKFTDKQKSDLIYSRAEKLIKKYFR
jgi:hypothetical protein